MERRIVYLRIRGYLHDPTPWPGLVGAPFVLLFNLVVTSAEDNIKTDGQIPLEPVDTVQALDLSKQLGILVHPAFVPAAKMPEVSIQNALEWADVMKDALKTGQVGAISVVGPPGPSYTVRRDDN